MSGIHPLLHGTCDARQTIIHDEIFSIYHQTKLDKEGRVIKDDRHISQSYLYGKTYIEAHSVFFLSRFPDLTARKHAEKYLGPLK